MHAKDFKIINWLLIIFSLAIILLKWNSLPPQIPLFYSRPWGEDQLTTKSNIFLLPAVSFFVIIINDLLSRLYLKKQGDLFEKIALFSSFFVSLLAFISLLKIIILVG